MDGKKGKIKILDRMIEKLLVEPREDEMVGWEYGRLPMLGLTIYGPFIFVEAVCDKIINRTEYLDRMETGYP